MSFKPILTKVEYIDEVDRIVLVVEHTEGDQVLTRTYEIDPKQKLEDIKTIILNENQKLIKIKPKLAADFEALLGIDLSE